MIQVVDGDTLTLLVAPNKRIKIHLTAVDCPEKRQAYGNRATQLTKDLVHGKTVMVNTFNPYGQRIIDVILDDGRSLSQELVKRGLARWVFRYSDDDQLKSLEFNAKLMGVGIWTEKTLIPPQGFQRRQ